MVSTCQKRFVAEGGQLGGELLLEKGWLPAPVGTSVCVRVTAFHRRRARGRAWLSRATRCLRCYLRREPPDPTDLSRERRLPARRAEPEGSTLALAPRVRTDLPGWGARAEEPVGSGGAGFVGARGPVAWSARRAGSGRGSRGGTRSSFGVAVVEFVADSKEQHVRNVQHRSLLTSS